ncbi:MAG: T9SS type A sorting domain-containing protein [Bacteroidota bacterium]
MKLSKQLLLTLFFLLNISLAFSQPITWQIHHGQGEGIFIPGPNDPSVEEILNELTGNRQPVHGDPGGFIYADIPPADDLGWETAPIDEDGDLCWRLDRSRLTTSFTAIDFTYFQTSVFIEDASNAFLLRFYQVDDGARAYVFNSAHPEGEFIEGGDARIYAPIANTDISPLFVEGEENRIVIVQFDDSQTENFLKVEDIRGSELNSCERDIEPPSIFAILENGSEVLLSNLRFDTPFECNEEPFVNVIVRDNCDRNATIIDVTNRVESIEEDGSTVFSVRYTAIDRSGNQANPTYTYKVSFDSEAPVIESAANANREFTLDACNELELTLEDLGISARDNCSPSEFINISLSQTVFEEAGDTEVTITAIDEVGNESTLDIKLSFESDPLFITVSASDDVINKTAASDGSIVITEEELLANDMASDGSPLEIQDLTLLNPEDGTLVNNSFDFSTYTFTPSENFDGILKLTYLAKSRNAALYFKETGHFYEYVPLGTTWDNAKIRAESRRIIGLQGYLATITSQAENDFIFERLRGNGWIGASDAAVEGEWRWITGPEAKEDDGKGLLFWLGTGNNGRPIEGVYSNWGVSRSSGAEPNNLGDEDYAHFVFDLFQFFEESEIGKWNDFRRGSPSIDGYIVEYGEDPDCSSKFVDEAVVDVTIIINENEVPNIHRFHSGEIIDIQGDLAIDIFPNPLQNHMNLEVYLEASSDLSLAVRDMQGKLVEQIVYSNVNAGSSNFSVNLEGLDKGVYFVSVKTAYTEKTLKAVIVE